MSFPVHILYLILGLACGRLVYDGILFARIEENPSRRALYCLTAVIDGLLCLAAFYCAYDYTGQNP